VRGGVLEVDCIEGSVKNIVRLGAAEVACGAFCRRKEPVFAALLCLVAVGAQGLLGSVRAKLSLPEKSRGACPKFRVLDRGKKIGTFENEFWAFQGF
jgi:hypothetical protein